MEEARFYLHILPREITSKIFSYLPLPSLIRSLARCSKSAANFVQEILADGLAAPNRLNILVTGLPGAGSTTLYSRLKDEFGLRVPIKILSESKEIEHTPHTPPKLVNDNSYQMCGIQLESIRANICHGSTKKENAAMMYAHCGAQQAILYTVSCGDIDQWKSRLQQDLVTYYALTADVEWIFVINKMDLVQNQEEEFDKCVNTIKNLATKVVGSNRPDRFHFVPMTANDMSIHMKSYNHIYSTWISHNQSSLWNTLNRVADEKGHSKYIHLFRKFNATIVKNFTNQPRLCIGIYIIDGCVSVGDKIQIHPAEYGRGRAYSNVIPNLQAVEVIEIQSNYSSRKMALPNSFVTIRVQSQWRPCTKYHMARYDRPRLPYTPHDTYFHAVLLHVGDVIPEYKWKGQISKGYTGAIHSLGVRGAVRVRKVLNIWRNQNMLDLKQIQQDRKGIAIQKGEKAEVILERLVPRKLNLTKRDDYPGQSDDSVYGRFVILNQRSHVVAVGVVTKGFAFASPEYVQYVEK